MLWQLDLSEAKRQLQGDELFPLNSGVVFFYYRTIGYKATFQVCNSFVNLSIRLHQAIQ